MEQGKIFLCDQDPDSEQHVRQMLVAQGHVVEVFASAPPLLAALRESRGALPDLVLVDASRPGLEGLETLRTIKAERPEALVVMMSGFGTVRTAVEAMKQGAYDFLLKPFFSDELAALVAKVVERNRLVEENRSLKEEIRRQYDPEQIVFKSAPFKKVFDLAKKVAPSSANVLILGESGTGKELIASTIHYNSRRRHQRFLTINCAALTDTLLESQLFGHHKGAFTGAVANQRGLVEEAHKGTLFLDEIGDISPSLQAKLLRVLQEKEFIPLGSTRVRHADVRFVAATNRHLEEEVARGNFREDLYYRLNVVTLQLPPLRERRDDIEPLARFFADRFGGRGGGSVDGEALAQLRNYDWPGNVRELENVIEMATIMADGEPIAPDHLPVRIAQAQPVEFSLPQEDLSLAEVERLYIEQVYRQSGFHKVKTSAILGIARKTLDRKLAQYGIGRES